MEKKIFEQLELFKTIHGNYWLPLNTEKDIVCQQIKSGKIFDYKIVDELKKIYLLKRNPCAVMLDVGANFGQMSVQFAGFRRLLTGASWGGHTYNDHPIVYSFEAEPFVAKVLRINIEANNLTHEIRILDKAVWWNTVESISFPEPDFASMDSWGSYGLDPNRRNCRTVQTITVDSLNLEHPIAFMKIDIQGSDLAALKGARETIKKHRMPIIFEYEEMFATRFDYSFQDYIDYVESINYKFHRVIENNFLIVSR